MVSRLQPKLLRACVSLILLLTLVVLIWLDKMVFKVYPDGGWLFVSQRKGILRVKMQELADEERIRPFTDVLRDKSLRWTFVEDEDHDIFFGGPVFKPYLHIRSPNILSRAIKIFVTAEAYRPDTRFYDLSVGFDHIDDPKYARLPYGYITSCGESRSQQVCRPEKDFACFLVSDVIETIPWNGLPADGVKERIKVFHALSSYKKVKSGGRVLNNIGGFVPKNETKKFLSSCKFVIAYENQSYPDYITEKVFNAYNAGAVPIYYGHRSVLSDINKNAVIYGPDFQSIDTLVEHVKKIDQDDKWYCEIWNQRLVQSRQCLTALNNVKQKFCKLLEKRLQRGLSCNYF